MALEQELVKILTVQKVEREVQIKNRSTSQQSNNNLTCYLIKLPTMREFGILLIKEIS